MYKTGHYGVSMILYSPFLLVFLLFDLFVVSLVGFFIMIILAPFPDIDIKISFIKHRGPTHTIWFSILVGIFMSVILLILTHYTILIFGSEIGIDESMLYPRLQAVILGLFFGTYGIISHIAGDVITPMGVRPFTPFKKKKYTFNLTKAASPVWNFRFWFTGIILTGIAFYVGINYSLTGLM